MAAVPAFLPSLRDQNTVIAAQPVIDVSLLNNSQRGVYDAIRTRRSTDAPVLGIVSGGAGTGKSFLIQAIKELLGDRCLLLAPTGVAAYNIGGETLHSALRLPTKQTTFSMLATGNVALAQLQQKLAGVELVVVDEYSMVGKRMLAMVEWRLQQAVPASSLPFGGLSVLLVGDLCQLPPVMDHLLYTNANSQIGGLHRHGYWMYRKFVAVFPLSASMRHVSLY